MLAATQARGGDEARILFAVRLSIIGLRGRLPLVVCVLLLFTCVAAVGVTCAVCVSAHPGQVVERTLTSFPAAATPPEHAWGFVLVVALASLLVVRPRLRSLGRASPAELQRFLF